LFEVILTCGRAAASRLNWNLPGISRLFRGLQDFFTVQKELIHLLTFISIFFCEKPNLLIFWPQRCHYLSFEFRRIYKTFTTFKFIQDSQPKTVREEILEEILEESGYLGRINELDVFMLVMSQTTNLYLNFQQS
jgi:hypothetical protein